MELWIVFTVAEPRCYFMWVVLTLLKCSIRSSWRWLLMMISNRGEILNVNNLNTVLALKPLFENVRIYASRWAQLSTHFVPLVCLHFYIIPQVVMSWWSYFGDSQFRLRCVFLWFIASLCTCLNGVLWVMSRRNLQSWHLLSVFF